ncbi:DUF3696 domain-containing protein [Nocardiopsis sp. NPDC055824]
MIEKLNLRNFKSWQETGDIDFSKITLFFGSNSSGKTSILQSLMLMKQTAESADMRSVFDFGRPDSMVELGNFNDILFSHSENSGLGISVAWTPESPVVIPNLDKKNSPPIFQGSAIEFEVEVKKHLSDIRVEKLKYVLDGLSFSLMHSKTNSYKLSSEGYRIKRTPGRAWPLPPPRKFYGFPDQVRAYYQNASFLSDLELDLERLFDRIYYLGPLRDDPKRQYSWAGGRPMDVGHRGEKSIEALISSQADGNTNTRAYIEKKNGVLQAVRRITVEQHVAEWLKQLGLIYSFDVKAVDDRNSLYRVLVKKSQYSSEVLLTDVGFGVSQVLPVLVLLAYVPEESIVMLEQPEIHLHPAVQSALADVLIEAAKVRNLQLIVESHSEHLLLRMQRRIAEGEIINWNKRVGFSSEDCSVYFCDSQGRKSTIRELELDDYGNIKNWPDGFFGNSLEESVAMNRAARKKRSSGKEKN